MKDFLIEIFAWWRGNTWGTRLWIALHGAFVGSDEFGNRYYRAKKGDKRMVVYKNYAEASAIPPGWHGWMHHRTDVAPTDETYRPRQWQKPHEPNLTGTAMAYRPEGSLLKSGERPKVTGDYEAWSPE
jgi:NADH:ubiquinone oxidoreductase subunit